MTKANAHQVVVTPEGTVSLEQFGTGPDLVVLHSLLTDRTAFATVAQQLANRWRVNLVDLPGFGDTTPAGPTIEAQARMVSSLLDTGDYDPDTTMVLGNGWGAFVALGMAVGAGESFDKLVLVGCGAVFPPPAREAFDNMIQAVESGGMNAVVDTAVRRIFPDEYLAEHPGVKMERARVLQKTPPEAFIDACKALIILDFTRLLGNVKNPTLVVVGSQDEATPPEMARQLTEIESAVLIELPNVGHAPQLQDPDRFLGAISGFLNPDTGANTTGES